MPSVQLGRGINTLNVNANPETIFLDLQDELKTRKIIKPTRTAKLTERFISSSSKLQDELKLSLGISVNSQTAAGSAQANFLKQINANIFDMFYVLELTEELYTEFLPQNLRVIPDVNKYFQEYEIGKFLKIKEFVDHYGNACVDSIVYGRKIIFVAQLKTNSHAKFTNKTASASLSLPADTKGEIEATKALNTLKDEDVENTYYYVSDNNNAYQTLTQHIGDIQKLKKQIMERFQKIDSKNQPDTVDIKRDDNKKLAVDQKETVASNSEEDQKKAKPEKDKTIKGNNQDDETISPLQRVNELVQLRFTTVSYSRWLKGSQTLFIMEENFNDIKNLLKAIHLAKQKISAFKDAINLAVKNADKLAFNDTRKQELADKVDKLNGMAITIDNHEDFLINQWFLLYIRHTGTGYNLQNRLAKLNEIIESLNSFSSELINFKFCLFLLKEVTVNLSTYFDGNKLSNNSRHSSRNSHYFNMTIFAEAEKLYVEVVAEEKFDATKIEFDIKLRKPVRGELLFHKVTAQQFRKIPTDVRDKLSNIYIANVRYNGKKFVNDEKEKRQFKIRFYSQTYLQSHPILHWQDTKKGLLEPNVLFDSQGFEAPSPTAKARLSLQLVGEQLGWNCFDLAAKLHTEFKIEETNFKKRAELVRQHWVKFALDNKSNPEFRKLLAPEIRQAFKLTATYLNALPENKDQKLTPQEIQSRTQRIMALLDKANKLDDGQQKSALEQQISQLLSSFDPTKNTPLADLESYMLPKAFFGDEKQKNTIKQLERNYDQSDIDLKVELAKPIMLDAKKAINTELKRLLEYSISKDEWLQFFEKGINQQNHAAAYKHFIDNYNKILVPHVKALDEFCEDEKNYILYLTEYYEKNGWVALQPKTHGEQTTSVIDIIAKQINKQIVVYQQFGSGWAAIHRTTPTAKNDTIAIQFNGRNHFIAHEVSPRVLNTRDTFFKLSPLISASGLVQQPSQLTGPFPPPNSAASTQTLSSSATHHATKLSDNPIGIPSVSALRHVNTPPTSPIPKI